MPVTPSGATSGEATEPGISSASVLVVDDEPDINESLRLLFESTMRNVRVLTAESGDEALKVLEQQPVDLVLTDYKMPGMDGLEFLARARGVRPGIPRIMMTAFPDLELAIRALNEERIVNFFTKPLDPEMVVQTVRSILEKRDQPG